MANPLNPKNSTGQKNPLARMLAGFPPDNQSPMPPQTGGMTPWLPPYQQPGAGMDLYRPMPNVAMTLPPYQQPGQSLPPLEWYVNRAATQPVRQQPAPLPVQQPAQQPAAMPSGGQGWGGPEPAPGTMPELQYDPMQDPRYLPEHWRGAFNLLSTRSGR